MVSWTRQLFFILILLHPSFGEAHIPMRTLQGKKIAWRKGRVLNFVGNPSNGNRVSENEFFNAVTSVLDLWERASRGGFEWEYWQGTDRSIYEANSNYNGQSSIYFTSQSGEDFGWEVIGRTEVWYDTASGEILETDIALNDSYYPFVGPGAVDLMAVLAHEVGHVVGLTHTGVEDASLYPYYQASQATLNCDDRVGAQAQFFDRVSGGGIEGRVRSSAGAAVFGAHVRAFSIARGRTFTATLTDKQGRFRLEGLPEDEYVVAIEAFQPGEAALTEYYRGLNVPSLCVQSGTVVVSEEITVIENRTIDIRDLEFHCDQSFSRFSAQSIDSIVRTQSGALRYPSSEESCALKTVPVQYRSPSGLPPRSFEDTSSGWCARADSVRYTRSKPFDLSWFLIASLAIGGIFRPRKKPC